MAKRLSSGQSNTLLNYFTSPKPKPKTENGDAEVKPKVEKIKPDPDDEDVMVSLKKRKKIAILNSDSEEDGSAVQQTPKKKSKSKRRSFTEDSASESETPKPSLKKFAFEKSDSNTPTTKKEVAPPAAAVNNKHSSWLHNRLDFLQPDKIRDANRNKPDHPDYDSRTVFVPGDFLNSQTPAMRQWWVLKSKHMDTVIFFKVGKFYELYHMDAVVGVTQLGFSYMKGDFAHSGFPESAYHKMVNILIEKGYKVARTEQTETPEMMAERCQKQRKTTKFDKVVNREICQISTKASCVYTAQYTDAMNASSSFMYAITEKDISAKTPTFGVCFVDTSIGVFNMAEFEDDKYCSRLLALFAEHLPGLILTEKRRVSPKLKEILETNCKDIRKEALAPETQFYSAAKTVENLLNRNYFRGENSDLNLPPFLKSIIDGYSPKPEHELSTKALGACLWFLEDSKLDIQVVSMGKFEMYHPINASRDQTTKNFMVLDSITIRNLNLLGGKCSLQKTVDYCQTAFGKRLLQQWICRPLCDIGKIQERQEAVVELYKNSSLLKQTQDVLKKLPDLERQATKIHTYGNRWVSKEHPDGRAIFYEAKTYSKRRITDLLKTLQGFERAQQIDSIFKDCQSTLLKSLTQFSPAGIYVDLKEPLEFFKGAFDQDEAQKEGKIIPKAGMDQDFDDVEKSIEEIKKKLDHYLKEQQNFFGCKVTYFGTDKKRFQIDVPDPQSKKVTSEYQLEGTKKGTKPSKRYSTAYSRQLLAEMLKAESKRAKIVQDLNRQIFEKFSQRHEQWSVALKCLTVIDVLCSFAEYARSYSQDVCMPNIDPFSQSHKIIVESGRHPCIPNADSFVPNDTKMGTEEFPNVLLITGPNMGGKSTLMRQIALICVMAQMGCYVPASSCRLNLIDRIFTRLGAHDDIVQGQSTFLVELSEASAILQHATSHSLVLLDELGRGTSTHDGNAIATAYVQKLTEIDCRTLFSTHYHTLLDYFIGRDDIQLGYMACMVENDEDPTEESVTFLYKMAKGRCPKSYGFNVARLAGLNHSIVLRGRQIAKEMEAVNKHRNIFSKLFSEDVADVRGLISSLSI